VSHPFIDATGLSGRFAPPVFTRVLITPQANPCLPDLFEARAVDAPHRPAVVAGNRTLSYGELRAQAARVAGALAAHGIGPGSIVAVSVDRNADLIPALLGVHLAGAAYLPIDPSYPRERIRLMLESAAPGVLLHSERHAEVFRGMNTDLMAVEGVSDRFPPPTLAARPEDLAYVIFTSGSTGIPKGVMLEHGGMSNLMRATIGLFEAVPSDRLLAVSTVS